jgi:hypothetical protein
LFIQHRDSQLSTIFIRSRVLNFFSQSTFEHFFLFSLISDLSTSLNLSTFFDFQHSPTPLLSSISCPSTFRTFQTLGKVKNPKITKIKIMKVKSSGKVIKLMKFERYSQDFGNPKKDNEKLKKVQHR